MREAATRAQLGIATSDDESIRADSLAVMEDAMTFFYQLALNEKRRNKHADFEAIRAYLREAVTIAKEVAPYRHARFSYVRVGGDRTNMPEVPDGETAQEIRAKLIADIASSGLLPTPLKKLLSSTGGDV